MPVFEYQGYSAKGKKTAGIVDADNSKTARVKLRQQGILATKVTADVRGKEMLRKPVSALFNRIKAKEITTFTRQLATLQIGGLTLMESLNALREQFTNVQVKKMVSDIREQVAQGSSLADALAQHPDQFDPLYVNLVRSGETSGSLDETLTRLAVFQENRLRQRSKLSAAMVYPIFMALVGGGVLLYLLVSVTPKVKTMFEDMNQVLPAPTIILLSVSDFLVNWWLIILAGLVAILFGLRRYFKTEKGGVVYDRVILKIPVFGNLARVAAISRFTRTLSVLLTGGVTLIESLKVTGKVIGIRPLELAIDQAIINITEGQAMSDPLRRSGMFPPVVTQMIDAGERSGTLTDMLSKIADAYDFEVETAVEALMALVGPVLILVMGLVVGFIVLSILLPIFELSQFTG